MIWEGGKAMYCPNCGNRLEDDALFCSQCGRRIKHPAPLQNQDGNRKKKQRKKRKKWPWILLAAVCAAGGGTAGLVLFFTGNQGQPAAYEAYYEPVDADNVCYEDGYVYVGSHLLVTAAENASFKQIQSLAGDFGGEIVGYISLSNDYQINFPEGRTYDELLEIADTMEADSHVFSAELELVQTLQADTVDYTTDPWGPSSGDDHTGQEWSDIPDGANWWAEAIGMPQVWSEDSSYAEVKVGLIDSYFDTQTQELSGVFDVNGVVGQDGINVAQRYTQAASGSSQGRSASDFAHGTVGAGIIAAKNDSTGICGISQNTRLYGVSLFGNSEEWNVSVMAYKYGIAWLLNRGVRIINISMGEELLIFCAQMEASGQDTRTDVALQVLSIYNESLSMFLERCLKYYDFLIVKSAGNTSGYEYVQVDISESAPYGYRMALASDTADSRIRIECDAKYDSFGGISDTKVRNHILIVGALDLRVSHPRENDPYTNTVNTPGVAETRRVSVADFSNTGQRVDIYAPGGHIIVDDETTEYGILSTFPGNQTGYMYGTSQAAPMVAGTAALVWGKNPALTASQVKQLICASADWQVGTFQYRSLNTRRAVENTFESGNTTAPSVSDSAIVLGYAYEWITDEEGNQMPSRVDAQITILNADKSQTLQELMLDERHEFSAILEPGDYIIHAEYEDYEPYEAQLHLEKNQTVYYEIEFALKLDYDRDRAIYTRYLVDGGYRQLISTAESELIDGLFTDSSVWQISAAMADVNNDRRYELILQIADTQMSGPAGYSTVSFLLGIEDVDQVVKYQEAYYTGGTMLGSLIYFRTDHEQEKTVAVLNDAYKEGVYRHESTSSVFSEDLTTPDVVYSAYYYAVMDGFDMYDDELERIQNETEYYYYPEPSTLACYQIDGQYVPEETYEAVSENYVYSEDMIPQLETGTYDDPIPDNPYITGDEPQQ